MVDSKETPKTIYPESAPDIGEVFANEMNRRRGETPTVEQLAGFVSVVSAISDRAESLYQREGVDNETLELLAALGEEMGDARAALWAVVAKFNPHFIPPHYPKGDHTQASQAFEETIGENNGR